MSAWDVVTVFTAGHIAVVQVETEIEAEALAEVIAEKGYGDRKQRHIVPTSQIGAVYWREKKDTV